jgi:ADP-ribosylglycohydrolase
MHTTELEHRGIDPVATADASPNPVRPRLPQALDQRGRFRGALLGTMVGDALGLPAEGLSRRRAARLLPGPKRHRFYLNRGMISDDTEHTAFVAQCLLAHPDSVAAFANRLGWCFRGWLVTLPAGVGLATLRATLRLWIGLRPSASGVKSAGNGPAMRAAPLGLFFAGDQDRLRSYVAAATRITHRDPRALVGARAIAYLTSWIVRERIDERPSLAAFTSRLVAAGPEDREWMRLVDKLRAAERQALTVSEFAKRLGLSCGVTGYVYDTVPVALYAWYRHFGNFRATLEAVLDCGGDTDTTGAIAGALAGAALGDAAIPEEWLAGTCDWPKSRRFVTRLADALFEAAGSRRPGRPVAYFWPGMFLRNPLFLALVLMHGIRRLAPPY